jgi:hypothetical protein
MKMTFNSVMITAERLVGTALVLRHRSLDPSGRVHL